MACCFNLSSRSRKEAPQQTQKTREPLSLCSSASGSSLATSLAICRKGHWTRSNCFPQLNISFSRYLLTNGELARRTGCPVATCHYARLRSSFSTLSHTSAKTTPTRSSHRRSTTRQRPSSIPTSSVFSTRAHVTREQLDQSQQHHRERALVLWCSRTMSQITVDGHLPRFALLCPRRPLGETHHLLPPAAAPQHVLSRSHHLLPRRYPLRLKRRKIRTFCCSKSSTISRARPRVHCIKRASRSCTSSSRSTQQRSPKWTSCLRPQVQRSASIWHGHLRPELQRTQIANQHQCRHRHLYPRR